jgi:dipeptidyl aminopeptidase/acylaminoacyl peptidase
MDTAVPVEQTEKIYESIKARGGHVEKKIYSQEGHGFRREETIKDALQMEIQFYEQVFRLGKNS